MSSVVFFGAGTSKIFGIPTMREMVEEFEKWINKELLWARELYNNIKTHLCNYRYFDVEALISVLEHITDVNRFIEELNQPSLHFYQYSICSENSLEYYKTISKSLKKTADELLDALKNFVKDHCSPREVDEGFGLYDEFFATILRPEGWRFAEILKSPHSRIVPIRLFTTNYDVVLERYCKDRKLLYSNGEVGNKVDISSKNTELYGGEERFRILKLHGSINWYSNKRGEVIATNVPMMPGETTVYGEVLEEEIMIYPARELYTFREPYYDMFHYLKQQLTAAEYCYVVGYSFRDDDIRGLFLDSFRRNKELKMRFIDPKAESIVEERLSMVKDRIRIISKDFRYDAIKDLEQEYPNYMKYM